MRSAVFQSIIVYLLLVFTTASGGRAGILKQMDKLSEDERTLPGFTVSRIDPDFAPVDCRRCKTVEVFAVFRLSDSGTVLDPSVAFSTTADTAFQSMALREVQEQRFGLPNGVNHDSNSVKYHHIILLLMDSLEFEQLNYPPANTPDSVSTPPEMVEVEMPEHPRAAKYARKSGMVWLSSLVDASGNVIYASVLGSSGHKELDGAAAKAAYGCKFAPARAYDKPVSKLIHYKVEFKINDE